MIAENTLPALGIPLGLVKLPTSRIKDERIRNRVRAILTAANVVPLIASLIGTVPATISLVLALSTSSPESSGPPAPTSSASIISISSSGGVTIQGISTYSKLAECGMYEEGFLVPLARIDRLMAEALIRSHSSIDKLCGLSISSDP